MKAQNAESVYLRFSSIDWSISAFSERREKWARNCAHATVTLTRLFLTAQMSMCNTS